MSYGHLRQQLPSRPLTPAEDRELQLVVGRSLSHAERFQWLCRTVEELRPLLGLAQRAADAPGGKPR